jgi:hypothetical protein
MNALTCPQCGSGDLAPAGTNRFRCQHCGVSSEQNQASSVLSVLMWACPKCGFDNEKQSDFCGRCGHELTKRCPRCTTAMKWDLRFCPSCRYELADGEHEIHKFAVYPQDRVAARQESDKGQGVITNHGITLRLKGSSLHAAYSDVTRIRVDQDTGYFEIHSGDGSSFWVCSPDGLACEKFTDAICALRNIEEDDGIFEYIRRPSQAKKSGGCCLTTLAVLVLFTTTITGLLVDCIL